MFDDGKGIVVVMQKRSPALIFRGLSETDGMVFEAIPMDEQDVSIRIFDTSLKLVAHEAGHGRDDRLGLSKGRFKLIGFAGANVEDGDF